MGRFSKPGDLRVKPTEGDLSWHDEYREDSLAEVYKEVCNEAEDAMDWYNHSLPRKRSLAAMTRATAFTIAAIAGLIPIVSQMWLRNGKPVVSPLYASILLTVAASIFGFDRYFGFSASWIRYIKTKRAIYDATDAFKLEWQHEKASWDGSQPKRKESQRMLEKAQAFVATVNKIIASEENAWASEYKQAGTDFAASLKSMIDKFEKASENG